MAPDPRPFGPTKKLNINETIRRMHEGYLEYKAEDAWVRGFMWGAVIGLTLGIVGTILGVVY